MSRITEFFRDADTQFGVFYPTHYLLAVFPNPADADSAQKKLRQAGRLEEDVISVSGEEVVQFADDHFLKDGLWGDAWKSLEPTHPLVARYYTRGGIEHLAGQA